MFRLLVDLIGASFLVMMGSSRSRCEENDDDLEAGLEGLETGVSKGDARVLRCLVREKMAADLEDGESVFALWDGVEEEGAGVVLLDLLDGFDLCRDGCKRTFGSLLEREII